MNEQELKLNNVAVSALRESAKWCMFLAIVGFIGIGLMVMAGLAMSFVLGNIPDDPYGGMGGMAANPFAGMKAWLGGIYIVMALLYFFPVYYLFNYAKGIKQSLASGNEDLLATALVNLKSHHKFLGIFTIVMISLYILMIIGVMLFAASAASSGM